MFLSQVFLANLGAVSDKHGVWLPLVIAVVETQRNVMLVGRKDIEQNFDKKF